MDYAFAARSSIITIAASILLFIAYLVGVALYRLYLSPLAHFPGPKLAALTQWYEFYYDVVLSGKYVFQIQKMHKQYGILTKPTFHSEENHSNPYFKVQSFVLPRLSCTWKTAITGRNFSHVILDTINTQQQLRDSERKRCYSLRPNTTCMQLVVRFWTPCSPSGAFPNLSPF